MGEHAALRSAPLAGGETGSRGPAESRWATVTVITTISPVSPGIEQLLDTHDDPLVLVGDRKTPLIESSERIEYLPFEEHGAIGTHLAAVLPADHYARKNIGYLHAIRKGAQRIYETDDDNLPSSDWRLYDFDCPVVCESTERFVNTYRYFTGERIWPRGYPLSFITRPEEPALVEDEALEIGVWSGLVDRDPDVDAIWRLTRGEDLSFEKRPAMALPAHSYCPFNSQNTLWRKEAFPFLYLPSSVSIRFTDILRGYVAQRLLWTRGLNLGFHAPTMVQVRNEHDLMRDFRDELECYLDVERLVECLEAFRSSGDPLLDIEGIYAELAAAGIVDVSEPERSAAWARDLREIQAGA